MQRARPDKALIEQVVIDAISSVAPNYNTHGCANGHAAILQVVDSLGFTVALANIQASLDICLDPPQLVRIYGCRSVSEMAVALEEAVSDRWSGESERTGAA